MRSTGAGAPPGARCPRARQGAPAASLDGMGMGGGMMPGVEHGDGAHGDGAHGMTFGFTTG